MRHTSIASLVIAAWSLLFAWAPVASAVVHPVDVNPADFVDKDGRPIPITNTLFPLPVGTKFIYDGTKDGVATHDEMCVTPHTRLIQNVVTTVVHHQSFENNVLIEDTFDYFAQDKFGNVWYFGEETTDFPGTPQAGTAGSWIAGENDADAGLVMLANPQVGDRYYQEFSRNVAEDQAAVVSLTEPVCVKAGCFRNILLTKETTRLEPGVVEYKYYVAGFGLVFGLVAKGGDERIELASIGKCRE